MRNALCLNQERDNVGTNARCDGLAKAMREAGGRARTLPIVDDDPRTPSMIARAVAQDDADGVLATNSVGGLAAAEGLAGTGVKIGTFDLGPDVLKAVEAGRIGFAVDQQAYLQGYLPIEMLALRARYGILPGAARRRRDRPELRHARQRRAGARAQRAVDSLTAASVSRVKRSDDVTGSGSASWDSRELDQRQPAADARGELRERPAACPTGGGRSTSAPGPAAVIAKTAAIRTALYS